MKLLITLCLMALSTHSLFAQIVPLNYDGKQKNDFLKPAQRLASPIFDSVVGSLKEKNEYKEFVQKKDSLSTYKKLAFHIEQKAYAVKQSINIDYNNKIAEIVKKIEAAQGEDEISDLRSDLAKLEQKKKSDLKTVTTLLNISREMDYRDRTSGKLKLIPVKNSTDAQLFYDNEIHDNTSRFLKNTNLSYSPDGGKASMYNEIYADYAEFVRVGIGVLISNKQNQSDSLKGIDSSELQKDAVQRLLGGGGNFTMNLSTPILNYESDFTKSEKFSFKVIVAPKLSLDVPKIGTVKDDYAVNFDMGLEGSFFYTLSNSIITFFGNYRFGYVMGNKTFYENILKDDKKSFSLNALSVGIALSSTFRINWNYYFGSSFVKNNFPSTIGFSIVPN